MGIAGIFSLGGGDCHDDHYRGDDHKDHYSYGGYYGGKYHYGYYNGYNGYYRKYYRNNGGGILGILGGSSY